MKGYTLIEILLVIAIVLTVGFLSAAFPVRMIHRAEIQDASQELRGALEKARAYAMAGRKNSAWGVHCAEAKIIFFKGDSFAGRDQSFDEMTEINEHISVSGFSETVFLLPGGRPNASVSGAIISWDNESAGFSVNEEGIITN
jgi:prepilin-type N-terminal cleavage/methylation domain-containing protein